MQYTTNRENLGDAENLTLAATTLEKHWGAQGYHWMFIILHTNHYYLKYSYQGGVAPIASVLPSATAVKIKVNGQLEIFFIVNSQATVSLRYTAVKLVKVKRNFSD